MTVFVILDGNNLAHYLFELAPLTPLTDQIDRPFLDVLENWAARWGAEVELCFDPRPDPPPGNAAVKILVADPGHKADGLILYRLDYHSYQKERCLVITSDKELQTEVKERGVRVFSSRQFLKQVGRGQYTFAPLPVSLRLGKLTARPRWEDQPAPQSSLTTSPSRRRKSTPPQEADVHQQTLAWLDALRGDPPPQVTAPDLDTTQVGRIAEPPLAPHLELRICLTPQDWPISEGVRFLKDSCCRSHLESMQDVLGAGPLNEQVDIPFLAEMLIETCGAEPDFVQRGGSLMDRVRLALLIAGPSGLSINELAAVTGDNPARIKQKVRQKQNRWLKIHGGLAP
jgi:hypothetical protein